MLTAVTFGGGTFVDAAAHRLIGTISTVTRFIADLRKRYALVTCSTFVLSVFVACRIVSTFYNQTK